MIGPAFSLHENAPRLSRLRLLLRPSDSLDERFWVRVGIESSLSGSLVTTVRGGAAFLCETRLTNRSARRLQPVRGLLRPFGRRWGFGLVGRRSRRRLGGALR